MYRRHKNQNQFVSKTKKFRCIVFNANRSYNKKISFFALNQIVTSLQYKIYTYMCLQKKIKDKT